MPAMKEEGFRVIKVKVREDAARALDTLALSSRRKGEIVSELLLAAKRRLADVRAGTAPMDEFTEVLVQLEYMRKFKSNQTSCCAPAADSTCIGPSSQLASSSAPE